MEICRLRPRPSLARSLPKLASLLQLLALALAWELGALSELSAQRIPDSTMVAHFIDVGQGAAALLEFSCGAVMVDAGGQEQLDSRNLILYLREFFRRRTDLNSTIETIMITHNHIDHTRSLVAVTDSFQVRQVVEHGLRGGNNDPGDRPLLQLAQRPGSTTRIIDVDDRDVTTGPGLTTAEIDPVNCSGTDPEITLLSADLTQNPGWTATEFRNKNNHSLVVRVDFGRASFLFTGDLEVPAIETLVAFYAGTPMLDVDVYRVGHHGSANATTWSLLEALNRPQIAVISMGDCTRSAGLFNAFQFGHPRADIVEMLRAAVPRRRSTVKRVPFAFGVRDFSLTTMRDAVYATGWDGTITVRATRGGRYRVGLERSTPPTSCG